MSNYTKTTDFGAKDALATGDPNKRILGEEIDDEFDAIAVAVATKQDSSSAVTTSREVNTGTGLTGGGNLGANLTLSLSHLGIQNLADPGADRLTFWDDSESKIDWLSLGTGLSIAGTTISLNHLGLQNLTDPNADRIAFWDDSGGALDWLSLGAGLAISSTTLSLALGALSPLPYYVAADDSIPFYSGALAGNYRIAIETLLGVVKVKSADQALSSDDTVNTDADLSGWTLAASAVYEIDGFLRTASPGDSAVNVNAGFAYSGTVTESFLLWEAADGSGDRPTNTGEVGDIENIDTLANSTAIRISGFIKTNATGTLDFRWAQGASNASALTLFEGSWIRVRRIA